MDETDRLHALARAVAALSSCRDITAFADILRRAAREIVGADGVTVVIRDGKMVRYVDEDAISPLWKGQAFPIAQCVSGLAILGREPIFIDDIFADPRVPHDLYAQTFVKSMAMQPVGAPDPVAAIGAYWSTVRTATPLQHAALEALAQAAAAALSMIDLQTLADAARQARTHIGALKAPVRALHAVRLGGDPGRLVDEIASAADELERAIGITATA
jgi:two-component system CheB/CheR fusion protein